MIARVRERERKRLHVSVKNKQKKKIEVAFGERERSSLFAFARTRLLAKQAIRVISVCLGKLLGKRGLKRKKEIAEGRKLILAPRSCSLKISGDDGKKGIERNGSRTFVARIGDWRNETSVKPKK